MINKINYNQVQNIPTKGTPAKKQDAQPEPNAGPDASVRVDHKNLIELARQKPAADPEAVQQAKKMLLEGELDSIENIQKAAQNIIEFGI